MMLNVRHRTSHERRVVWKYEITVADGQEDGVEMPEGARILSVWSQTRGIVALWALVDPSPDVPKETRRFVVVGTGQPFPAGLADRLRHLGTVQDAPIPLVWHVFEEVE